MKITLCLSIKFWQEMLQVQKELESLGYEVLTPPHEVPNDKGEMIPVEEYYRIRKDDSRGNESWIWDLKEKAIRAHFEKVAQSDVILVLNYYKKGIRNYIGANTLLEMGLAFWLKKRIYLLNPIPEELDYAEEIKGMMPIVINNDLENLL
ncbi:hypothetical protein HN958_02740 [Candidatus Falkowbacteria bacterium]|jgi:hypothetical protein|nr:hypothetical protein [Candidatus Falkowbacteria bacterium]MBT7007397.1 hypothetical protein [Candidatus Falkowbacteria bacterium]